MKKFTQYRIITVPINNELISGILWQFDFAGITEIDNGLIVFVDPTKPVSENEINNVLESAKGEGFISEYYLTKEVIEDKNWNEEYEKNVRVIEVSERLVIKPTFKDYLPKKDQIIITIDPKMSFGTGEHETTKLILRMVEKYIRSGDLMLDVGSGTGILAIASVLLGAKKAIGVDNDEWCLLNGKENIRLNSLEEKVDIRLGEIDQIEESGFDIIAANINKHILFEIAPKLKTKIKETGTILLSGLLNSDESEVIKFYSRFNFKLELRTELNEWIALAFKNNY
jgi:ribosomal protein L11 methyltransferase